MEKKAFVDIRNSLLWLALLPGFLAVLIYLPAVWFDFISLDDNLYILDNPEIKLGISWEGVKWAFTALYTTNWHPLTWLSLLAEYQFFGLNPAGYHIVGLALHALNSVLLFLIVRVLTGKRWRSLAVAALFAVHPLNIESVVWIAERKNLLSTLFWILTIWSYVRYVRRPGFGRYLETALLFALGLMAKPMAVSLPFILLLLDYWPLQRFSFDGIFAGNLERARSVRIAVQLFIEKLPFFVISLFSVLITIYAAKTGGAAKSLLAFPLPARLENAFLSYFNYLKMLFNPVDISIYYPYPGVISPGSALAAFLLLSVVTGVVIFKGKKYGYLAVGWFWYLLTLLPVIGIIQVGRQAMANRYAYIPFIGIFVIIAWGIGDISRRFSRFKFVPVLAVILLIGYFSVLSALELKNWKDSRAAYTRALQVTKDNHIAALGIGNIMLSEGNLPLAEKHYREALRIRPDYELAHYNLGLALLGQKKMKEAESSFREALKYDPSFVKAADKLNSLLSKERKLNDEKGYR
ncbi:MAG: tetratricopeptide repeat protein [Syntrophales bacterium]